MKKSSISKTLIIVSALSTGFSLANSIYNEAQASNPCRWQQVNIPCNGAPGGAINAEFCLQGGNGNSCGPCGSTTRNCP